MSPRRRATKAERVLAVELFAPVEATSATTQPPGRRISLLQGMAHRVGSCDPRSCPRCHAEPSAAPPPAGHTRD
jgi:hypothetical protein